MAYTPGPLHIEPTQHRASETWYCLYTQDRKHVACVESEEDAQLFIAAPDLLAACEAARLWLDNPFHEATARQVDAAILKAKAKGE